jgi:hypothetical protein
MKNPDEGKKAFTMAVFAGTNGASHDEDTRCFVCGKAAERMLRFTDFTKSDPLEMRWCASCWHNYLEAGKLENPMEHLGAGEPVTSAFLISELNLTELPLPDALERLYGACDMIKGGCVHCGTGPVLPLVGPLKIKSKPLGCTLDSLLGPIGMQWDISHGVLMIAHSTEELELLKQAELAPADI